MVLHDSAEAELADARRSAERLGIEFHEFHWREEFFRLVQTPFIRTYQAGQTPNPCVICNKTIKFGLFLDEAHALGYDKMATGHYARIERDRGSGRWLLLRARDAAKDQSYVLYSLSQERLSQVLLPMGEMTKAEARALAQSLGLAVAQKHDSQDICFVPDGDYMRFLLEHGVRPQPGHFLGMDGRDFGPHRGQEAYTLGQRRGLDIPYGTRIYVVGKTAACTVHLTQEGAELLFDEPQRAVTPGQAAVLYDGDVVLGGGTICGSAAD